MTAMRALRYFQTGPASDVLKLVEIPRPVPGPGEVCVAVKASGINPHDTKKRSGWTGADIPAEGVTPHSDGAGIIVAVGEDVSKARLGARVFVLGARLQGTAAEFVVVENDNAIALPDHFSFAEGACLGVPAFTAWLSVLADGPITGDTVLVQGGGGAVGRVIVELAARSGARVIATAGSKESRQIARAKGAERVLDRHSADVVAEVLELTGGRGVNRLVDVDFGANCSIDVAVLAPHGTVAAYSSSTERMPVLDYYAFARKSARLDFVQGALLSAQQLRAATKTLAALFDAGLLRPDIAAILPFEQAAQGHDMVEAGAPANVVITSEGLVI